MLISFRIIEFFLFITKFAYNNASHTFTNVSFFEINIEYNSKKCYEEKSNFKFKASATLNQAKKFQRIDNVFRQILESIQQT